MSDILSWVSIFIAVGSLVVSILSLISNHLNQRRIVAIERQRQREKELTALQASLRPELRKTEKGSYRLYLVNSGMAEARNVRVNLDGVALNEHPVAVRGNKIPTRVGPNSEVSCVLAITLNCAPPFEIEIEWEDDSGMNPSYRSTLTF
ncbi:MAG: hypothetical protein KM312_00275 [Hydrogenibacillus schlegelii]|uniref:Uncharacterized protein n=1 Tax=Hydrogenibacillus schlegelii TaxID=1484 RepID=A0A947G893_HYDSH|nr:hypothetical protein [Hydrogenibacillus schlegelii]